MAPVCGDGRWARLAFCTTPIVLIFASTCRLWVNIFPAFSRKAFQWSSSIPSMLQHPAMKAQNRKQSGPIHTHQKRHCCHESIATSRPSGTRQDSPMCSRSAPAQRPVSCSLSHITIELFLHGSQRRCVPSQDLQDSGEFPCTHTLDSNL